jgi:hypothetical protein
MCDYEFANLLYSLRNVIADKKRIFKYIDSNKHSVLSNYDSTANARKIVINHLRSTIAVSFIKEAYEEVTEYLRYVLCLGAKSKTIKVERLSANTKVSITANDILSAKDYNEVVLMVTNQIFQSIESERSTIEMVKKICTKLGLSISDEVINDALLYLEMRHIFVHNDGKPSKQFTERYPSVKVNRKGRIDLTSIDLHFVKEKILALVNAIDLEMSISNLIPKSELNEPKNNGIN